MKNNLTEIDKTSARYFDGHLFDSLDELYFYWWTLELKRKEIIVNVEPQVKFTLFNGSENYGLEPVTYTPDFLIMWKNIEKPFEYFRKWPLLTYVEIKPDVRSKGKHIDLHNNEYITNLKIKWMFDKKHVYVQVVRVVDLFKKTFCPVRCLKVMAKKIERPVLIDEFLNKNQ